MVKKALTVMQPEHHHLRQPMLKTVEHISNHPADIAWLVNVIGLVDPDNEMFGKGYQPPKVVKPKAAEPSIAAV